MQLQRQILLHYQLVFASMQNYINLANMFPQRREHTSDGLKVHSQDCYFPNKGILGNFDVFLVHAPDKTLTRCQPLLESVLACI